MSDEQESKPARIVLASWEITTAQQMKWTGRYSIEQEQREDGTLDCAFVVYAEPEVTSDEN